MKVPLYRTLFISKGLAELANTKKASTLKGFKAVASDIVREWFAAITCGKSLRESAKMLGVSRGSAKKLFDGNLSITLDVVLTALFYSTTARSRLLRIMNKLFT